MEITSTSNTRVKEWVKLKKKKNREAEGLYLVEGFHLVEEAIKAGVVKSIITSVDYSCDIETFNVTEEIIQKISSVESPQPIIAVCTMQQNNQLNTSGSRYLILDNVQDPGNIGTIVRSALAFSYDQVILSEDSVDLYNDKFIRATQGACFHISCIKQDLSQAINLLKDNNVTILGTSLDNATCINEVDNCDKLAIVLGNEGQGVSSEVLLLTDQNIYIPISTAESLNVAVAGGICMYHFNKK